MHVIVTYDEFIAALYVTLVVQTSWQNSVTIFYVRLWRLLPDLVIRFDFLFGDYFILIDVSL